MIARTDFVTVRHTRRTTILAALDGIIGALIVAAFGLLGAAVLFILA